MAKVAEKLIGDLKANRFTSRQLYALGQVLYSVPRDSALVATCQKILAIVPQGFFDDLDEAFQTIPWDEVDSILPALRSILTLNLIVKSPPRKAPTASVIRYLISNLASSTTAPSTNIDAAKHTSTAKNAEVTDLSLEYMRLYLLRERDIEDFLPILHQLQENQRLWSQLTRLLKTSSNTSEEGPWHDIILRNFPVDQTDYLSTLIRNVDADATAAQQSSSIKTAVESVKASTTQPSVTKRTTAKTTPEQEVTRRIEQVKMVVPAEYGDGFIEAALSQFQGSVEITVARILEPVDTWPAVLQMMDRRLPRRAQRKFDEDDPETREIVKARIKEAAEKEEKDALLLQVAMRHDEYEDDYDDQYDDMDGGGAGDVDVPDDYEAVMTYNRVLRGIEAEQGYFDEIRNTNREGRKPAPNKNAVGSAGNNHSDDDEGETRKQDGEKTYRGPDKFRGGRIPGRGRGGGRGRGPGTTPAGVEAASATATPPKTEAAAAAGAEKAKPGKPNLKSKQRKLDKRRDQQKNAQIKRAG